MDVTLSDGVTVTLADRLDFRSAQTITNAIALFREDDPDIRTAAILAMVSEYYLVFGVVAWSFPEEVTANAVRKVLLVHPDVNRLVEAASSLYQPQVIDPLVERASRSSEPSQTAESTSPTPSGTKPTPRRSRQSSISTIPTVDTGTMSSSPDGAYSSSQSLELAAS